MSWFAAPTHVEPYTAEDGLRDYRVVDSHTYVKSPYLTAATRSDWLVIVVTLGIWAVIFLAGVLVGKLAFL